MRLIVADDEYFARRAIVKMLMETVPEDEVCLEAETGREIMEYMEEHPVDVVFTDIRMPDGDGLEVAEFVRKHYPETSVVIISGYADFAYASAAIRFGVEDYLTKPVQKEKLKEAMERICERRSAQTQAVEEKVESRMELEGIHYMTPEEVFGEEKLTAALTGRISGEKIREGSWQMLVIRPGERIIGWSRERLEEQLQYFAQHLERMQVWGYYFYPREEFLFLAAGGQTGTDALMEERLYLNDAAIKMLEALERDRKIFFAAAVSGPHQGLAPDTLAQAYRECAEAMGRRRLEPEKRVILWEVENGEPQEEVVSRILAYVEEHYRDEITLSQIAGEVLFMNASYLSRIFKSVTGKTFSRYLIEYRMKRAAQLLETGEMRISDVAQYAGYNDTSYFIQTFKKYYHMTPEQYRMEKS